MHIGASRRDAKVQAMGASSTKSSFDDAGVPAWQLGRAKACDATLQGVAPRSLARPKGLVFRNLDMCGLLLKY